MIIRQIGMETYGLISLAMIFGGAVVFADFGISKSVTLLIGQDKDKTNVNSIVSNALAINLFILSIIGIVLFSLFLFDVPILGERFQISSGLKTYIILIGFLILGIMLINNLFTAILESYYLMHFVNIGFTISSILLNVMIYVTSLLTDSIYILLLAPLFAFFLVSLYFLVVLKKNTDIKLTKPELGQVKKMLSISYKFLNLGLVNSLMIPANKYLLIYLTGNSETLGVFDIALKLGMIANSFLNSIAQPLFGVFSNMNNKHNEIYRIANKVSLILFGFYIVGNVLFFFTGLELSYFIDNENYSKLFEISTILLLGITFSSISEPFYRALIGSERLKEALYLKLLIPIVNFSLLLILFKYQPINVISIAYSSAILVSSLFIIFYFKFRNRKLSMK